MNQTGSSILFKTYSSEEHQDLTLIAAQIDQNREVKTRPFNIELTSVIRPMQYLGSKYRSLPAILSKVTELVKGDSYVLDLFSGTSVVSQALNLSEQKVIANDVLGFNSCFAGALLNVGRDNSSLHALKKCIPEILSENREPALIAVYKEALAYEKELLSSSQTEKLLAFYQELPQAWKAYKGKRWVDIDEIAQRASGMVGQKVDKGIPMIASFYAGTYFSLKQALDLDWLRNTIERFFLSGLLSKWQYNLLLTCLLSTTSKVVHSAGKHFAQPIKPSSVSGTKVMRDRFYSDRTIEVSEEFREIFSDLSEKISRVVQGSQNIALNDSMENLPERIRLLPTVSVIYADPPYTAQQYSRFYHIPEVIYENHYPEMQIINGVPTSGLYPVKRDKSRFCSKREVRGAFEDMFRLAKSLDSHLVLSYSASQGEKTGNERMISLEQIIESGKAILEKCEIEVVKLDFVYRQLNKTSKIVQKKEDNEYLIVFKKNLSDK